MNHGPDLLVLLLPGLTRYLRFPWLLNAEVFDNSARTLLSNDSASPFSPGASGSMYSVSRPAPAIQARIAWAINSGPWSLQIGTDAPR